MTRQQRRLAEAFARERDVVFRALDEAALDRLMRRWRLPRPHTWQPLAKLASMHKARLYIDAFTPEEKAASRQWLAENGFTEETRTRRPCPECGSTGPSHSNCSTCGTLA